MVPGTKRVLVVAQDIPLGKSRVQLLEQAGYEVESVASDNDAMALLETEQFDLIPIGRNSLLPKMGIDQRLREKYPEFFILEIVSSGDFDSIYSSRNTDSQPSHVLNALNEMLGDGGRLIALG